MDKKVTRYALSVGYQTYYMSNNLILFEQLKGTSSQSKLGGQYGTLKDE
jgi:hypothetical protein